MMKSRLRTRGLRKKMDLPERRPVCLTERERVVASSARRDEGVGSPPMTEEQRSDATQVRVLATEGKPVGALAAFGRIQKVSDFDLLATPLRRPTGAWRRNEGVRLRAAPLRGAAGGGQG